MEEKREELRKDRNWSFHIDGFEESHLITAIEPPTLAAFDDMLVASDGQAFLVVLKLPEKRMLEMTLARLMTDNKKKRVARLTMQDDLGKPVATWVYENFEVCRLKLQRFDRTSDQAVEVLLTCTFKSVTFA